MTQWPDDSILSTDHGQETRKSCSGQAQFFTQAVGNGLDHDRGRVRQVIDRRLLDAARRNSSARLGKKEEHAAEWVIATGQAEVQSVFPGGEMR